MRPLVRVLVDESHRQAWSTRPDVAARMNPRNPADAGYVKAFKVLADHGLAVNDLDSTNVAVIVARSSSDATPARADLDDGGPLLAGPGLNPA